MLTQSASRSVPLGSCVDDTVRLATDLQRRGWTRSAIRAQLDARRWQRFGRVVVLHTGPLTDDERRHVALLNCGRRAVFTSFTVAQLHGLAGWEREAVHVLVPAGTRPRRTPAARLCVHYAQDWSAVARFGPKPWQQVAPALLVAAGELDSPRSACGILAAGVQQRLTDAGRLATTLASMPTVRHAATLRHAIADIAQGAEALSEIDFARLCRRHRLPAPDRQGIRPEPSGRRRYLDAEWDRPDGRRLVAEIDGALHTAPMRWYADQLRQNEIAISTTTVLRFPSVIVRTEPGLVVDQLRRALA